MASLSAREFNQNVSLATRLANEEPVFITRRGQIEYVLISIEEYRSIRGQKTSLLDALYMPEAANIDFDEGVFDRNELTRGVDFDQ